MTQTTKSIFIALISLLTLKATAQTPSFYHPIMYGENSASECVKGIVGNADGSYYVAGSFTGSTFTIGAITLTNASGSGNTDVFVAKFSSEDIVLWAKSATGGSQSDSAVSIAKDGAGNIYVAGTFQSSSITFGTTTLTNASSNTKDMFIVKYDANGTVIWAKKAGGTADDNLTDIAIDDNDNIYLTGDFSSASLAFGTTTLTNLGLNDIFYSKYDSNGNPVWANSASTADAEYATAVTTDTAGSIYIIGSFLGGQLNFGTFTLNQTGFETAYIVKLDAAGIPLWANTTIPALSDKFTDIIADRNGNVFVTGNTNSATLMFSNSPLQVSNNSNNQFFDIFLLKYNSAGAVIWAKGMGDTGDEIATSVNVDACGYIYVTGRFNSGSITFNTIPLLNQGGDDLFLLKYDDNGNEVWGKSCGSTNNESGTAVSTNIKGNIILAGYTNSINVPMDGLAPINNADNMGATSDFFLTKVQTTATDIFVTVNDAAAQAVTAGMVYLYSRQSSLAVIHAVDSLALTASGQVHFTSVLNLNYFVKVVPNTATYPGMVTTYNGNFSLWDSIATWPHSCTASDYITIVMMQETNTGSGNGKISGYVKKTNYYGQSPTAGNGFNRLAGDPVPGADVKIGTNPGSGAIVASTVTDANGLYSFNNMDIGNYTIYVDIPGLGKDSSYSVNITATDTLFTQLNYIADSDYIYIDSLSVGIAVNKLQQSGNIIIAPNPFSKQTTVFFTEDSQNKVGTENKILTLTDVLGNEIRTYRITDAKKLTIEKGDLQPGIYFVSVQSADKSITNKRIVIQ